jgi:hypothetical protein
MTHGWAVGPWFLALLAAGAVVALALRPSRRWLSRTRTAVGILTTMTVLALAGVFVGQGLPPEAYVDRHGPVLGALLVRSGLTSVFTSPYFLVAVAAFALSILACTFGRLKRLVRATAGRASRIGSLTTHLALVVIIAGGIVTAVGGFRRPGDRYAPAGAEIPVPEGGFSLRIDEARTDFTDEGVISEYTSIVTVLEDGEEVRTHRIEVNHPLVHRGIGVYQYEMLPAAESVLEVTLGVVVDAGDGRDEQLHELRLPFRESVAVPGTATTLKAVEFLSHFSYDIDRGTAVLVSVAHENPAVLVQVSEGGRVLGERWAFAGFRGHDLGAELPCRLFLLDYRPDFENGLTRFEFTRQPGTPLLYLGFAALSLGLVLTFWTRVGGVGPTAREGSRWEVPGSPSDGGSLGVAPGPRPDDGSRQ